MDLHSSQFLVSRNNLYAAGVFRCWAVINSFKRVTVLKEKDKIVSRYFPLSTLYSDIEPQWNLYWDLAMHSLSKHRWVKQNFLLLYINIIFHFFSSHISLIIVFWLNFITDIIQTWAICVCARTSDHKSYESGAPLSQDIGQ